MSRWTTRSVDTENKTDTEVLMDLLPAIARIDLHGMEDDSADDLRERYDTVAEAHMGLCRSRRRRGLLPRGAFKRLRMGERLLLITEAATERGITLPDYPGRAEDNPVETDERFTNDDADSTNPEASHG